MSEIYIEVRLADVELWSGVVHGSVFSGQARVTAYEPSPCYAMPIAVSSSPGNSIRAVFVFIYHSNDMSFCMTTTFLSIR